MADVSTSQEQVNINTGSINISNDVVSTVASLAASSVSGVSGMVSSISGGFAELLGKKNMSKGVKVSVTDKKATLDLAIIVEYGAKIPDVAWEIQEKVKSEVEAMTGLSVIAVNVSVEGVNVPKDDSVKSQPSDENSGSKADVVQTSHNVKDAAVDAAVEFVSDAKEKVEEFTESAKEKAADILNGAKEKADEFAQEAKEKSENFKKEICDIGENIADAAEDITEAASEKIEDTAEAVCDKAKDIAEDITED